MATVIVGTKHVVWFQSRLRFSSVHISLDRGIRHSCPNYSSDFWADHPLWSAVDAMKSPRARHFFGHRLSETSWLPTFAHQRIIRIVDSSFNERQSPSRASACPAPVQYVSMLLEG